MVCALEPTIIASIGNAQTLREIYQTVPAPAIVGHLSNSASMQTGQQASGLGSPRMYRNKNGTISRRTDYPKAYTEASRIAFEFEEAAQGNSAPELYPYMNQHSGHLSSNMLFINNSGNPNGRHYICIGTEGSLRVVPHSKMITAFEETQFDPYLRKVFNDNNQHKETEEFLLRLRFPDADSWHAMGPNLYSRDIPNLSRLRYVLHKAAEPLQANTVYLLSNLTFMIRDSGVQETFDFRANAPS